MGFTSGKEIFDKRCEEAGIKIEGSLVSFGTFEKIGLPPVVACSCCEMTMTFPSDSCYVDDETQAIVCKSCAGIEDEESC